MCSLTPLYTTSSLESIDLVPDNTIEANAGSIDSLQHTLVTLLQRMTEIENSITYLQIIRSVNFSKNAGSKINAPSWVFFIFLKFYK